MSRKSKPQTPPLPSSSHPEAERGVSISGSAVRSAIRQQRRRALTLERRAIVSINGCDVEEIPKTPVRAA